MKHENRDGYLERETRIMLSKPITELARFIGAKWYLPLEMLAERTGVPSGTVKRAIRGEEIPAKFEKRLREYLEQL